MNAKRFKQLLWADVALIVLTITAPFFSEYSPALKAAFESEPSTWLMNSGWLAYTLLSALVIVALAGFIGLFWFKSWARSVSLYSTILCFIILPFCGTVLQSGTESMLAQVSATFWGMILTLSYFSTVSERFHVKSLGESDLPDERGPIPPLPHLAPN